MNKKHTPGPWRVERHAGTQNGPFTAIWHGQQRLAVVDGDVALDDPYLMAAAPDLLEACKAMAEAIEGHERRTGHMQMHPAVEQARAAVANATGGTP